MDGKIQALILQNHLGTEVLEIQRVLGGLSHSLYKVRTNKGIFAIKELDPAIMRQKEAYNNFVFSEKVARIVKQVGLNAVCALQFHGNVVLKIEDSFFMVFDWIDGSVLKPEQVKRKHCEIIGQTLAEIHNINFFERLDTKPQNMVSERFDFEKYIPLAKEQNKPYAQDLQNSLDLLVELNMLSAKAVDELNDLLTISHADLDRKNVMWQNYTPFLIDWEASGCINPTLELMQVAWYWAGGDVEQLDHNKFEVLVESYVKNYNGKICTKYTDIVYANSAPKLAWLEYNLKRSLTEIKIDFTEIADHEISKSIKEIHDCVEQFDNTIKLLKKYL